MTLYLPCLDTLNEPFPPVEQALNEPNGLLAFGGNLHPETILQAYQSGIFPWFSDDDPILWWSPTPRAVIRPAEFKPSKSLRKHMRRSGLTVTLNKATPLIIKLCASTRSIEETWITQEMQDAYIKLAHLGHCHSIEVWQNDSIIGGLYGLKIGRIFCGESMFSSESNASKIAFWHLCHYFNRVGGQLIDCQIMNDHLLSLGVIDITRESFISQLDQYKSSNIADDLFHPQTLSLED
ncbi:leucyl/phenylalanyl-tRNA--protein transferase [Vibrio rumoiensis]|uniref:Leucyl/phenylalanyl-tRNA--protein transferase n=1 Tax=Vibrio rumoiensis 1S-45 TaxID=1188252 RepID=A0A1E5E1X7_9VIBR|nr:leucyl/phenylalanyl-tRNA--protein transferase [Vibrio rumoiensis]OEF25360.1 leucyl/phenylalanyl-tRNA--protein transferase [Vibrio rumoiensis 1S-45]